MTEVRCVCTAHTLLNSRCVVIVSCCVTVALLLGVLIELSLDGSGVNRHFHNLAHWYGRKYYGLDVTNPVNIAHVIETVRSIVRSIDINKY